MGVGVGVGVGVGWRGYAGVMALQAEREAQQDREVVAMLATHGLNVCATEVVHNQSLWNLAIERGWSAQDLKTLFPHGKTGAYAE